MNRSPFLLALLVGCGLLWPAAPAEAQRPLPIRDRPTFSPWLNLYRDDPGPVGPYLSNVRPEQRLLGRLSQQRTGLARQRAAVQSLRTELSQPGPRTGIAPTGVSATFMNYSHFFGGGGGTSVRRSGASWSPPAASSGGLSSSY